MSDRATTDLPRLTRALLSLLLIGIIGTYAYCTTEQVYLWPFSPHPMYSGLQGRTFGSTVAVLVGPEGEQPVRGQFAPFTSSMVRANLAKTKNSKQLKKVTNTLVTLYQKRRAQKAANHPKYPELLAIRIYKRSWKIRPGASNKDTPHERLLSQTAFLPTSLGAQLNQEAAGKAVFSRNLEALETAPGDVVIEVETAPGAPKVKDNAASEGGALILQGGARRKPSKRPKLFVDLSFKAKKGRYKVWLRGKSKGGRRSDSVWLQFDRELGTQRTSSKQGFGNWRNLFPKNAYGWASAAPGKPTKTIKLKKDGTHRLRVSAREGTVLIDQVWLSKVQNEMPLSSMPRR